MLIPSHRDAAASVSASSSSARPLPRRAGTPSQPDVPPRPGTVAAAPFRAATPLFASQTHFFADDPGLIAIHPDL